MKEPSADIPTITQDQAEYFTHITYEAPADSPYGWMNRILAVGVMTMVDGNAVIDSYQLTNFPDAEPENP